VKLLLQIWQLFVDTSIVNNVQALKKWSVVSTIKEILSIIAFEVHDQLHPEETDVSTIEIDVVKRRV
jgi:hypothetical protein